MRVNWTMNPWLTMISASVCLVLVLTQAAPAEPSTKVTPAKAPPASPTPAAKVAPASPAPASPAPASAAAATNLAPAEIGDVRCPEKLDKAACSKITSVMVSLAQTSLGRKKLRSLFAGAVLSVDVRDAAIEITAKPPADKLSSLLDNPMRLHWQARSSSFQLSGQRLRDIFDALQEFLAVLAPELALHGLSAFERSGMVSLVIQSGASHLHLAVDRAANRIFLGATSARPDLPAPPKPRLPPPADEEFRKVNPY